MAATQCYTVVYREFDSGDLEGVLAVAREHYNEGRFPGTRFEPTKVMDFIDRLHVSSDSVIFLATTADEYVGYIGASIAEPYFGSYKYVQEHAYYVREAYRALGVGRGLRDRLEAWAKANGAAAVQLHLNAGINTLEVTQRLMQEGWGLEGTIMLKRIDHGTVSG